MITGKCDVCKNSTDVKNELNIVFISIIDRNTGERFVKINKDLCKECTAEFTTQVNILLDTSK